MIKKTSLFTIYDIARELDLSTATISRALNRETKHKVAPKTRRAIEKLAKKHGFTPNQAARSLRTDRYEGIGLVFAHHRGILASDYYGNLLSGAADFLIDTAYRLKAILLKPNPSHWDDYDFKNAEGVDGLILTYWRSLFSDPQVFERLNIPCVIINNVEQGIRARFISADHYEGGRMAAAHLFQKGHRNIVIVGGKKGAPDAEARLEGFYAFLAEQKIPASKIPFFDVNFEEEKAYEIVPKIRAQHPRTTAIFCMNDAQAFGVLRRLKELGVSCPKTCSVMGYDGEKRAESSEPPLTTLKVPVYELAKTAARDLVRRLKGDLSDTEFFAQVYYKPELMEGGSVATL